MSSRSMIALTSGIVFTALLPKFAWATSFDATPRYQTFSSYSTTNPFNGDATDIYYPTLEDASAADDLPIALMLQGALVDKSFYSDYASQVARHGFAVVVPNHFQTTPDFGDALLSETSQPQAVLDQLTVENGMKDSPLNGKIDTGKLGLLGHSFGGAVGLSTIGEVCLPVQCAAPFERPEALMAGAFFGANLRDRNDAYLPIKNDGVGVALIQGDRDGRALPLRAKLTYDQVQSPPRARITLSGVNHFGITDVNMPDGAIPDPTAQTVDQTVSIETTARWSGLFLRGTLLEDEAALEYVLDTGAGQDPIVVSVEAEAVPEPSTWVSSIGVAIGLIWLCRRYQLPSGH
ncbi:alpha/beta hydrolase [cf. Phormidesmis sp. LEGE 11477]|uniref:alpha/beta hydrolase family protein n=1 Tax=cf. Phormidesmis sp. LEGE 11477 TaxID=1828680 RepID=UPI00187FC643|nr:alpha/beta hydrolase [cf. Phormidesmis sp. LEGE 11477]MBE9059672.1 alpha/beta hydrolase [cf. Phormidesmis sp. LEGE 11477]